MDGLSAAAEAAKQRAMETDPSFLSLEQILGADDDQLLEWFPTYPSRVQSMMTDVIAHLSAKGEVNDVA